MHQAALQWFLSMGAFSGNFFTPKIKAHELLVLTAPEGPGFGKITHEDR